MTEDIRHAAGFVLYREAEAGREYLLLKNASHGTWGFPKGHRDGDESDLACARRELLEETQLSEIEVHPDFERLERYELPKGRALKSVRYFLARLLAGEPCLSAEHARGGFMKLEEALARLQHASARELLLAAATCLDETKSR